MPRGDGDTKQRIRDEALRLFNERGYDHTAVADIAAAVNVANAALYYYFTGKDTILRSLVEPLIDAIDDLVAVVPELAPGAESRRPLIGHYLDLLVHWRPVMSFVALDPAVLRHPELGPRLADQQSRVEAILAGPDHGPAATVAASAALGALRRPVVRCQADVLTAHRDVIVDAAVRALGAVLP